MLVCLFHAQVRARVRREGDTSFTDQGTGNTLECTSPPALRGKNQRQIPPNVRKVTVSQTGYF